MTKLGIIEAGDVHNSLSKEYGTYFDMIQKWLEPSLRPEKSFNVLSYKNEILPNPNLADFGSSVVHDMEFMMTYLG